MDVNEHMRLFNITLRHKLVRNDMDVNEHTCSSLRHKLKERNSLS